MQNSDQKLKIDYKQLIKDSRALAAKIKKSGKKYASVYGVPAGGLVPALIVSQELKLPLVESPLSKTLVVDDLIDSGRTLEKFKNNDIAVLYEKEGCPKIATFWKREISADWIHLPHEKEGSGIEQNIVRIFQFIGDDPNRVGLKDTPARVAKMYKEIFRGYDPEQKPKITIFPNGQDGLVYDQMITDTGKFYSQCEHHMIPFFGDYYFAYIPNRVIIGLSKVARIVDYYSAKLQIQERLVKEIVDEIESVCKPRGIALVMKGNHLCKQMRGVKKEGVMTTSFLTGSFKREPKTREEFLKLAGV